jgi:hypothetical protein
LIRRIRELMRTPLARPPGRRGVLRFAPEIAAAVTYSAALLVLVLAEMQGQPHHLKLAVATGLTVGAFLTFAAALAAASRALARERDLGTMEALLLASPDHRALVRGRFWCVTVPWLRLFVYLLPLYLALAGSDLLLDATGGADALVLSVFSAFSSRLNFLYMLFYNRLDLSWDNVHAWGLFLTLLRWANHASVFLFTAAAAYWISARARNSAGALLLSCVAVPASLTTLLGIHEWLVFAAIFDLLNWQDWMVWLYVALIVICVGARLLLTWYLLRRAAREVAPRAAGGSA